jgi:hypothetical protein
MTRVSHDTRDGREDKSNRESVPTFAHIGLRGWMAFTGNQLQVNVRNWLSPPDPSMNHNIARRDHMKGTASWFTQSDRFKEWTMTGSLLWIHGKRTRFSHFLFVAHPNYPDAWFYSGIRQEYLVVSDSRKFSLFTSKTLN